MTYLVEVFEGNRHLLEAAGGGVCKECERVWPLGAIAWDHQGSHGRDQDDSDTGFCPYCDMPYLIPLESQHESQEPGREVRATVQQVDRAGRPQGRREARLLEAPAAGELPMSAKHRAEYMTTAQRAAMGQAARTHQNCRALTGVARPGKTRQDRARRGG